MSLQIKPKFHALIASGDKTVEGRLARSDGRGPGGFEAGDVISVTSKGSAPLSVRVTKIEHFPSFKAMLERHLAAALPGVGSVDEGVEVYREIYGDRDRLRGVSAIHLALSSEDAASEIRGKFGEPKLSPRISPSPALSPAPRGPAMQRNSTSFIFEVSRLLEQIVAAPDKPGVPAADEYFGIPVRGLRLHQARALVCAVAPAFRTDARGLLVDHTMGTGKGVLMAAIMNQLIAQGVPAVLFTNRSLMGNFAASIEKYEEVTGLEFRAESVRYASMNASNAAIQAVNAVDAVTLARDTGADLSAAQSVSESAQRRAARRERDTDKLIGVEFASIAEKRGGPVRSEREVLHKMSTQLAKEIASFDGVALFIDEAHLFARAVTNGSQNATAVYQILARSPKARVFLFTGTPGVDDPFELSILLNMVGPAKPRTLPENYQDFSRTFVGRDAADAPVPRNAGKFMNRCVGLVSHQGADEATLPRLLPYKIHRVPMDKIQWEQYTAAREREREEAQESAEGSRRSSKSSTASLQRPSPDRASTYRQRSRQLGDSYVVRDGLMSPKAKVAVDIAEAAPHMVVLYSQYIDRGCKAVAAECRARGWVEFGSPAYMHADKKKTRAYALVIGETEAAVRQQLVKESNDPANFDGSRIKLVIVSIVGALGLSFLLGNEVIIFEPYWNVAMHDQIIARVRRFDSFANPPIVEEIREDTRIVRRAQWDPAEHRRITPHVLLAVPPACAAGSVAAMAEPTTDIHMWEGGQTRIALLRQFREMVRRVSVEAVVAWDSRPPAPRICEPTGNRLFAADFAADLALPDPCVPFESYEVSAQPVTVDGRDLFCAASPDTEFGFELFQFSKDLNAYEPVSTSDPAYSILLDRGFDPASAK